MFPLSRWERVVCTARALPSFIHLLDRYANEKGSKVSGRVEQMWDLTSRSKHCSTSVVVIQAGDGKFIWYWDNGGLFEAGGDCRLIQGEVNTSACWPSHPLRTWPGMPSGPVDFCGFSLLRTLLTYAMVKDRVQSYLSSASLTIGIVLLISNQE